MIIITILYYTSQLNNDTYCKLNKVPSSSMSSDSISAADADFGVFAKFIQYYVYLLNSKPVSRFKYR